MISLELAKKLKEVGLNQSLEYGDLFYHGRENSKCIFGITVFDNSIFPPRRIIRAPHLDQLLSEITKRWMFWALHNHSIGVEYCFQLMPCSKGVGKSFWADTPEDAAGQALLWILETERQGSK